jgi:TolB-like protein/Flp pilus assembly protein TadD
VNPKNFFAELKRRNVYKVAVAYAVVAWLLMQIASQIFPFFEIPNWIVRLVVLLLIIGFPIALIIAWAFELTPEGIKRTESADNAAQHSRGGIWIAVVLIAGVLSLSLFFLGRYTSGNAASRRAEAAPAILQKSIAVLPFESLSEEKSNAYFADGIQDEILTRLAKIADLKVISRISTQKYKSAPTNLREIAQQLGVGNVLEGTVQKAADQVRVSVQLINALNDSHLWAETYDRKLVDLFQVETEIAQKIAGALEARLTGREKQQIAAVGTANPEAYDTYLHALALLQAQSAEETKKFVELSRRVVELDPNFMQGWALLATAETQLYLFPNHTATQLERARNAAERTLQLGPDTAEAHKAMGVYYYCIRDYDRALGQLALAKDRAPNNADVQFYIGLVQRRNGQVEQAIESMLTASKLDPLNVDIWTNIARTYRGLRKFDDARAMYDRALAIKPNEFDVVGEKAEVFLAQGDVATAWSLVKDLDVARLGRGPALVAAIFAYQRRFGEAIKLLRQTLTNTDGVLPVLIAARKTVLGELYALQGDHASAKPLFEEAAQTLAALRADGDDGLFLLDNLLQAAARLNDRPTVERTAAEIQQQIARDKWGFVREEEAIARAYTILGEFDRALPLLKQALTEPQSVSLTPAKLRLDPFWDPVRNDARFQKLANTQP